MQFGTLTAQQQIDFLSYQISGVRSPSFTTWIEGFSDVSDYVKSIETDRNAESLRGFGNLAIGVATIVMNNENRYFYSDGKSNIPSNARIKIYAGFHDLNIPIFSGIIYLVSPQPNNVVILNCRDYMGFFFENFVDNVGVNQTTKAILDYFCSLFDLISGVPSTSETLLEFYNPTWTGLRMMTIIEKICDSLFSIAYFDEDGILRFVEHEYSNSISYTMNDTNITDIYKFSNTEIINSVQIGYQPGFFSSAKDQVSIDSFRERLRLIQIPSFDSGVVSSFSIGNDSELLNNDLEGFLFNSDASASYIDTIHLKLKSVSAVGYLCVKIYSNSAGVPSTLLATSVYKPCNDLSGDYAIEYFTILPSLSISPSTDYWCIIDTTLVSSGSVYLQITTTGASAIYAYNDGTWHTETNKYPLHNIKGLKYAKIVSEDIIRFYKNSHERIRIHAPAIQQLQLYDEVFVNSDSMGIRGRYKITGIRTMIKDGSISIFTLEKK